MLNEQKQTEIKMEKIKAGQTNKQKKVQIEIDKRVYDLVSTYDDHELLTWMDLMSIALAKDEISIRVESGYLDDLIAGVASL